MSDPNHSSPNPLDYEPPAGQRPQEGGRRQFWTGLVAGSVASMIFWGILLLALQGGNRPLIAIFAFLTIKLLIGIGLSLSNRWKLAGRGVFISLGVGTLIFLGTCGIAASSFLR